MPKSAKKQKNIIIRSTDKFGFGKSLAFMLAFAVIGGSFVVGSYASSCQSDKPYVQIHNNYNWASPGTYALQGQRVMYAVQVYSYDCSAGTYTVNIKTPDGFSQDVTQFTTKLRSRESKLQSIYVTSPANIAQADYPITATVSETRRDGSVIAGNVETNYYKVYLSDTEAPKYTWQSNQTGQTVSGIVPLGSLMYDTYMARKVSLYIDGVMVNSALNDGVVGRNVSIGYNWDTRRIAKGQHTITFKGYDDFNNEGTETWLLNVQ